MEASDFPSLNSNLTEKDVLDTLSSTLQSSSPAEEAPEVSTEMPPEEFSKSLTAKNAVQFLLNGTLKTKVCRYCLNVASPLSELDQVLHVAGQGVLYKVTIREMIASFHPFKVAEDQHFPNKICDKCIDRTLSSYLFTQQCERSERALRNYFEDMFEKLEKLDPVEKTKRRGRTKSNPNPNVLIAAHEKVIDYAEPLITIINIASELSLDAEKTDSLICPKCCLKMPNLTSLLNHEKSHPSSMWYHCHLCGKSFPKRIHLRRHIHCSHAAGKLYEVKKTDFKCQDCGTVSKDYNTHLQHIEKHKFREVMDLLVTRKMDKLCAVCLNRGVKLVELEKMVCLHGGYPEMMGDRTLYNILGSTVPETSSYKYRDLLVASQAKVLSLVKHSNKEEIKTCNIITSPTVLSKDENIDGSFVFSATDYCNKKILNINDNEKPIDIIFQGEVKTSEVLSENADDHEKEISNTSIQQKNSENAKLDTLLLRNNNKNDFTLQDFDNSLKKSSNVMDKMNFVFSEPILNIQTEMHDVIVEENVDDTTNNLCKRCWVFKKAIGKTCLECTNMKNVEHSTICEVKNKDFNKKCTLCWLFKNCKQCGYCIKSNITEICNEDSPKNQEDNFDDEIIESDNFNSSQKNEKQCLIDPDDLKSYDVSISTEKREDSDDSKTVTTVDRNDNNNKSSKANKRKMIDENPEDKAKRSKWQCQICLTTNWKRELCFCCNSPRSYNKIKYNFKFNNDFFNDFHNNNEERKIDLVTPESKTGAKEIENIIEDQTVLMNDKTMDLKKASSFCIESVNNKITNLDFKNDHEPVISSPNDCVVSSFINDCYDAMAVDPNENVIDLVDSKPTFTEVMEIAEDPPEVKLDTSNALKLVSQSNCSNQLQSLQFQFNIGNNAAVPKIPGRKILKRSRK